MVDLAISEDERRSRGDWDRHFARWEAFTELRERCRDPSDRLFGDDRGTSKERACKAVSDLDGMHCSPEAVKSSIALVEAAGGADATFESYKALLQRRREF